MESAPAAPSIIRLARLTASIYIQFLSHTLYTRKNFSITDQPVFAYRQPCAFGCIMIAVRYSPCSSQAEKRGVGNDGVRWRLGFGGSAVRQVSLCSLTAFSSSLRVGGRLGCRPNLPEGILPSDSHLRFAAVKSGFRVPAVRQVTLCSLTVFSASLRVGNDWAAAQTCLREFFPQTPISASRRLKAAFVCQPSVR